MGDQSIHLFSSASAGKKQIVMTTEIPILSEIHGCYPQRIKTVSIHQDSALCELSHRVERTVNEGKYERKRWKETTTVL